MIKKKIEVILFFRQVPLKKMTQINLTKKENLSQGLRPCFYKNLFLCLSLLLVLFLGLFLGRTFWGGNSVPFREIRQKTSYQLINPLLDFEELEETKRKDLVALRKKLEGFVESRVGNVENSKITHISIYFRELKTGPWIGINENEKFTPASLLKVPLMIAYFKIAETNPSFLSQEIKYQKTIEDGILYKESLVEGRSYTINELIRRMIVYSDNQATFLLLKHLKKQQVERIYQDLGLEIIPKESTQENIMLVKEYSSFFRVLYNASYLNKEMSEKALQLLLQVKYDQGLVAGVPKEIKIAHKFGDRGYSLNNIKQLHDCGIIYHPKKPYLLCVMTRGTNIPILEETIREISKIVYQTVNL